MTSRHARWRTGEADRAGSPRPCAAGAGIEAPATQGGREPLAQDPHAVFGERASVHLVADQLTACSVVEFRPK